eukprot:m.231644 g.231644  ORF g.231644 m.231644 type:complete len:79 (+) comp26466_c1_seq18:4258-4494(+)
MHRASNLLRLGQHRLDYSPRVRKRQGKSKRGEKEKTRTNTARPNNNNENNKNNKIPATNKQQPTATMTTNKFIIQIIF